MTYVRSYRRRDGTFVRGHVRRSPLRGLPVGLVALGVLALVVVGPGPLAGLPAAFRVGQEAAAVPEELVVQFASSSTREEAEATRAQLADRLPQLGVLRSDDYIGLRAGWWVTYSGPYPDSRAGRAQAEAVQQQAPGSMIRSIRPR